MVSEDWPLSAHSLPLSQKSIVSVGTPEPPNLDPSPKLPSGQKPGVSLGHPAPSARECLHCSVAPFHSTPPVLQGCVRWRLDQPPGGMLETSAL